MNHKKILLFSLIMTIIYTKGSTIFFEEAIAREWVEYSRSGNDSAFESIVLLVCILPLAALDSLEQSNYKGFIFAFSSSWVICIGVIYLISYLRKQWINDNHPSDKR